MVPCNLAMSSPRVLDGINNSMPGPGVGGARGYVILGSHASWTSAPIKLAFNGASFPVIKEQYDYMVRGLDLTAGGGDARVACEDGSEVECKVTVQDVC